jgi:hypothetical protein
VTASKISDADVRRIEARLFPERTDVFARLRYTPSERQAEFHSIPAFADGGPWDVLFGGAMGGGKTKALVLEAIDKAITYPGLEVWFVRETYPDLERDVFPFLEELRYAVVLGGKWHGGQRTLSFPGGGKVRFLHARNKVTALGIRGQCQMLIVDERTLLDPDVIDTLALRIRSGHSSIPVIGIRSGCNPGGIGHSTTKLRFIDPAPAGRVELPIVDEETGRPLHEDPHDPESRVLTRWFLPSLAKDNPHLDASYEVRFSMMSADARAAFRDGDWSRFEGMRFAGFVMGLHVVRPEQVPLDLADLSSGIGIDWGRASPFAAVWGALINGGETLVVYRELHQAELTTSEQAALVLEVQQDPEVGQPAWIDPSTFTRNAEDPSPATDPGRPPPGSVAAGYLDAGVAIRKGTNARIPGWALIDELLLVPDDWGVEVEVDGEPRFLRLYIYDTCPNLIRSLTGAPRDPKNPEDVDDKYRDDHALDAFRYLVMGLVGGPLIREPQLTDTGARAAAARIQTGVR